MGTVSNVTNDSSAAVYFNKPKFSISLRRVDVGW
jgi:hypothetical protein